mgnify:CR=1 FL=1
MVAKEGVWLTALWMGAALRVSAGLYVGLLASGWAALLPQILAGTWFDANVVVQLYGSQLIYLLLTRLLVAYREQAGRLCLETLALHELAHTDPLTHLANRRSSRNAIKAEPERHPAAEPVSLLLLDLDRFKAINDTHGHEVGGRVLVHVAELLHSHSRKGDQVGRWGGEEFVLLLPNTLLREAQELVERLQGILNANLLEGRYPVSASFGVATAFPEDTADSLVSRADRAMYRSKQAGGNRVVVATAG